MDAGALPVGVVSRTCVYNVGFGGLLESWVQEMRGGEIERYNAVLEEARVATMAALRRDALALGAEEIVGLELEIFEVASGLLEFHAYGTAVRYDLDVAKPGAAAQLPPQALVVSRPAFTEAFGIRGVGSSHASGEGSGQASAAAVSAAQAEAGYSAAKLLFTFLTRLLTSKSK
jgi:uncharacterized protein YbjQ (UPF0145 family)